MAFLGNDAINRVNLHSGIQSFAMNAGGIFFLVIMLRAGLSIPTVLLAQAAIWAGRFALRPLMLPLARRWGVKPLLIVGTVGIAIQYPVLAQVDGVGFWLFALIAISSAGEIFYWLGYNTYFAAIGDNEHRGHQIAAREAVVAVVGVVAPLAGAWALISAGPVWTFWVIGFIQAASALPLIGAPNVSVKQEAPGAFRAAKLGMILIVLDGWFDVFYIIVWQIALFVSLGGNIAAYGGAMALAGLVGAVCGLFLGRIIDAGRGRRAVAVAYSAAAALLLFRAGSLDAPWLAVMANAVGALLWPLMMPALGGAAYNLAKVSPCPFRFHMATEAAWDVGGAAACLATAALAASGVPLGFALLLALPGVALSARLLWRYYPAGNGLVGDGGLQR